MASSALISRNEDLQLARRIIRGPVRRHPPLLPTRAPQPSPTGRSTAAFDPRVLLGLTLPAHVVAHIDGTPRPAWLIGRPHCADGWVAVIQYSDDAGREFTIRLPADQVTTKSP